MSTKYNFSPQKGIFLLNPLVHQASHSSQWLVSEAAALAADRPSSLRHTLPAAQRVPPERGSKFETHDTCLCSRGTDLFSLSLSDKKWQIKNGNSQRNNSYLV